MSVTIGSARINENGKITGGRAGDQTGNECSIQSWYLSSKGWVVVRPINPMVAERIAKNMGAICNNQNIGYCQDHRNGLYNASKQYGFDASKVNSPVEVDCSEAVRCCLAYAGISVNTFTTASEVSVLNATREFDILTSDCYCKKDKYLKRGDILVTRSKGHTAVVLGNGSNYTSMIYPQLQKGDKGVTVGVLQKALKRKELYHGAIDNDYGSLTQQAVIRLQGLAGLTKDGICGNKSWAVIMAD